MAAQNANRKPGFFWQGALILLPVAVMAVIGLYSLRQDKLLAEQDAQESGKVLAQRLAEAISAERPQQGALQQLRDYRDANFDLRANRSTDLGQSQRGGGIQAENAARERVKAWQRANPEIDLSSAPYVEGWAKSRPDPGMPQPPGLRSSFPFVLGWVTPELAPGVPGPPEWPQQLNPGQKRLWQAAQESEFISKDYSAAQSAIEQFIASKPPDDALANAEYLLLLTKTRGLPRQEAAAQFSSSQWRNSGILTEAGLPVGQLICYQALRLMPDGAGLTDKFIRSMGWAIAYRPSMFSSRLVSEAERVARHTDSETNVATLAGWWRTDEATQQILEDFRDQHPASTWTNAPFWMFSGGGEYLLFLSRKEMLYNVFQPGDYFWMMFPKAVVEKALATAVGKSDISLPAYALVEFEMAGKKIPLSRNETATNGVLPVLGQAAGTWSGLLGFPDSVKHPFQIRVLLANPDILYARQHERTLLFGGLILVSAIAAGIGFLTAQRAFYRQLRLNEMKSDFVASVSHELRAPIASVRLMAEGLERGKISEPGKQHEYFKFIVQECRRLSSLIENVLDFSRIEQGRKQYELEPTDLAALTEKTVTLMETYAAERQISLTLKKTGEPAPVELDGKAMQQALVNLIDNAIKHSPKGAEIIVGLEFGGTTAPLTPALSPQRGEGEEPRGAGLVGLWVEDRGEGIPAAEHEKIFERFYRVGSELRRETQGVGIGLSIVKHIVEAHGGRVTVRSAPGAGSRFTIELPASGVSG